MMPLQAAMSGRKVNPVKRAVVLLASIAAVLPLLHCATPREELVKLSDFFAISRVSGGMGPYRWEASEIYVLAPGKKPEYIGTSVGGPPQGMGPLSEATKDLRATTMAISKDGRSLVFIHWAQGAGPLEPGIYRYEYGAGIRIVHRAKELSGLFYTRYEKALPTDVLPFKYMTTYTPKDLRWALTAGGDEFPLGLYEATPLHWAAFEGRMDDCARLIKSGADINARTYWDFTALDLAIIRNHEDAAIGLMALGADPNSGPYPAFHRAVMLARMKVVQAMVDSGAGINATDSHGYTPLHLAVFAGTRLAGEVGTFFDNAETPRSILDKNVTKTLVRLLLDKGADPYLRDKYGKTQSMRSARERRRELRSC